MKRSDKISIERYQKQLELVASSTSINPYETPRESLEAIERAKKDFAFMVQRYFPHYASADIPDFHINASNRALREKSIKMFLEWGRAQANIANLHFDFAKNQINHTLTKNKPIEKK